MIRAHGFLPDEAATRPFLRRTPPRRSALTIPETIEMSIFDAYDRLSQALSAPPAVAVRSSAIGEDSAYSFTGQFLTLLNVKREGTDRGLPESC